MRIRAVLLQDDQVEVAVVDKFGHIQKYDYSGIVKTDFQSDSGGILRLYITAAPAPNDEGPTRTMKNERLG